MEAGHFKDIEKSNSSKQISFYFKTFGKEMMT